LPDAQYEDRYSLILDVRDYAIVTDSVSPESAHWTGQRLPKLARILPCGEALLQIIDDSPSDRLIDFA